MQAMPSSASQDRRNRCKCEQSWKSALYCQLEKVIMGAVGQGGVNHFQPLGRDHHRHESTLPGPGGPSLIQGEQAIPPQFRAELSIQREAGQNSANHAVVAQQGQGSRYNRGNDRGCGGGADKTNASAGLYNDELH